jgi:NurA domain
VAFFNAHHFGGTKAQEEMLVETLDYAVSNRQEILSRIDLESQEETIEEAKGRWTKFQPSADTGPAVLAGIDSSWNFVPYQGFFVYAVDAVTLLDDGSFLVPPVFDVGLSTLQVRVDGSNDRGGRRGDNDRATGDDNNDNDVGSGRDRWVSSPSVALESIGMEYEYQQARASVSFDEGGEERADLLLVDGSILARFYDRKKGKESSYYDFARELARQQRTLFISKTSYSNTTLGGSFGDIFYYNALSAGPGYSEPWLDERTRVSVTYLRLAENSPSIRLEVPGDIKGKEIEDLMGTLLSGSVDGYPYVLRLAHERGKITHEEMGQLANLLGLSTQLGGRQVLGE